MGHNTAAWNYCNYTHSLQPGNNGVTPLMMAALHSARETARFLLAAGASTNVLDSEGFTALFSALQSGDTVISEWLAESTTAGEAGCSL